MGYTAEQSQIRAIPIFVVAAVLSIIVAYATDYTKHRYAFIVAGCVVGIIGYAILLNLFAVSVDVRYMAAFFITMGGFMAQPITLAYLQNNLGGHVKRGYASAFQIGFGNLGKFLYPMISRELLLTAFFRWYCCFQHLHQVPGTKVPSRFRYRSRFPRCHHHCFHHLHCWSLL